MEPLLERRGSFSLPEEVFGTSATPYPQGSVPARRHFRDTRPSPRGFTPTKLESKTKNTAEKRKKNKRPGQSYFEADDNNKEGDRKALELKRKKVRYGNVGKRNELERVERKQYGGR